MCFAFNLHLLLRLAVMRMYVQGTCLARPAV